MPVITTITPMPPAPNRTMTPAAFVSASDATVAALGTLVGQINTVGSEMNDIVSTATTQAGISTTKAAESASSADASAISAASAAAIAGAFVGTSVTSLTIGVGSRVFTTQPDKQYTAGIWMTAVSTANSANWMFGQVTSYSGNILTIDVQVVGGSGTLSSWNLSLTGARGAMGPGITPQAVGFTLSGGTTPKTLTVTENITLPGAIPAAYAGGLQTAWIPAAAMYPRVTSGAESGTIETATNKNIFKTLDFDTATIEYAQFTVHMPKSWDAGTVTFSFDASHASGSGNIAFTLAGVSCSDGQTADVAFGTAAGPSAKTVGVPNVIYISAVSPAITVSGAGKSEYVMFQIARNVAADTLGVDARLHGVQLFYTTNAATDA